MARQRLNKVGDADQKTSRRRGSKAVGAQEGVPTLELLTPSGYRLLQSRLPMAASRTGVPSFVELANLLDAKHLSQGRRGLAVCAAAFGSGVSFVASNLAVAMAMSGRPTHLVEANLRTPSLDAAIQPPEAGPGLSDYLMDEGLSATDIIRTDVLPGLSVTFAGDRSEMAADLLPTDRFDDFAQTSLRDYVFTIFDTSPANRAVDARVVAKAAGYALIVARHGRSFAEDVATLSAQLVQDGVLVIGTVMNRG
jgi:Mrp family chromosome partitioning ATPase